MKTFKWKIEKIIVNSSEGFEWHSGLFIRLLNVYVCLAHQNLLAY